MLYVICYGIVYVICYILYVICYILYVICYSIVYVMSLLEMATVWYYSHIILSPSLFCRKKTRSMEYSVHIQYILCYIPYTIQLEKNIRSVVLLLFVSIFLCVVWWFPFGLILGPYNSISQVRRGSPDPFCIYPALLLSITLLYNRVHNHMQIYVGTVVG